MKTADKLQFTIPDLIALIAATAIAFAGTRHKWEDYIDALGPGGTAYTQHFHIMLYQVRSLVFYASFFTAARSVTCFLLVLTRHGNRSRPTFDQPGLAACLAATILLGFRFVNFSFAAIVQTAYYPEIGFIEEMLTADELARQVPSEIGGAVIAIWAVLWASGRWQSEAHWIDRSGRVLGLLWIGTIPFASFTYAMWD